MAALILAAGQGTRFGAMPKLLTMFRGRPLVRHVAEAALASRASPVLAVLGHRRNEVAAALDDLQVRIVDNPDYAEGLSTSLRFGFAALPDQTQAAVVLLADMPCVSAATVDRLIEAWHRRGCPAAVIPSHAGQRGNPVLLSRILGPEVTSLTGDRGAGQLLRDRPDVVVEPVDDPAVLLDVDTPEGLRALDGNTQAG